MTSLQTDQELRIRRSYTAVRLGVWGRITELSNVYRAHTSNLPARVAWLIEEARQLEGEAERLRGFPLCGGQILEIGAGQCPIQLAYFGKKNEATGIDLDVIPKRLSPQACIELLRRNGVARAAKTIGRKALGVDRRLEAELRRQLGCNQIPPVCRMDATRMRFHAESFDLVFSRAVFEHISEPARALAEIRRVLKVGGVAIINLHLYTHDTGCHDARILCGNRGRIPFWAHLRPQFQHLVKSNVYLNCLRLAQWREIFARELPGSNVQAMCDSGVEYYAALRDIRAQGELAGFTDEELLSTTLRTSFLRR